MLANLRLEQLKPSESLSISIQDYIAGTKSTDDLLKEARIQIRLEMKQVISNFSSQLNNVFCVLSWVAQRNLISL